MLLEISEDRIINPLSDNIIGIQPSNHHQKPNTYILYIGCQDGIDSWFITKEDRDLIVMKQKENQK